MKFRMPATNSSVSPAEQVSPTAPLPSIMGNVVPGVYSPQINYNSTHVTFRDTRRW